MGTGDERLRCPFCGHVEFERVRTEYSLTYILKTKYGLEDDHISEGDADYQYSCAKCRRDLTDTIDNYKPEEKQE